MEKGFLYVTPDYRNFPQVILRIPVFSLAIPRLVDSWPPLLLPFKGYGNEMVQDVERSIIWVTQNIKAYGGTPRPVLSRGWMEMGGWWCVFGYSSVRLSFLPGDPNNITVVGQSAGAHLSSLVLVRKATAEFEAGLEKCDLTKSWSVELDHSRPKWSINQIKRYIGVSGPYDLAGYVGYGAPVPWCS